MAFCERPTYLHAGAEKLLADYWAASQDDEMLLVLDAENPISTCTVGDTKLTGRNVSLVELAAARVWIENWERMLPVITTCRNQLTFSLQKPLLKFIDERITLGRIEQQFVTGDPTLVRAAVFTLLHQGYLQAPQLQVEPLSYLTFFQPGRAAQ